MTIADGWLVTVELRAGFLDGAVSLLTIYPLVPRSLCLRPVAALVMDNHAVLYDITPPVTGDLKVWPGDTAPTRRLRWDMQRGDGTNSSSLHSTVHLGAHADAPCHCDSEGVSIGECGLDPYIGSCQVIRVEVGRGEGIRPDSIKTSVVAQRVLFATGTFPDPTRFNEDFASLSPELIESLHGQGVKLVGIDTPSVDLFDSKDLPTHRTALRHNMAILEGLILDEVSEGMYELIALPLKLMGFDASPVRAILRSV